MFLKFGLCVSSGFLNTKKLMKAAECFYCIRVLRNPYETRSSSLWNGFSKGSNLSALHTKAKQRSCLYLFFAFSCFIKLLKHEQICKSVLWKMFLCDFCNCGCLIEDILTLHWPPLSQFWKVEKLPRRDKSCQFRLPKVGKKKFLRSNFRSPKVQYKEKWAVDVFRNWQATREKNHIL